MPRFDPSNFEGRDRLAHIEDYLQTKIESAIRAQLGASATGVLVESSPIDTYTAATAPSTQIVYGRLLGLRAGDIVTGILMRTLVAAAGTLPTTARFGIANSAGTILALSGNENATAQWGLGANPHPFTAPLTIPTDGGYYACFVVNGVWGSTPPTPLRGNSQGATVASFGSNPPPAFTWAAQTDLPAVGSPLTISGTTNFFSYYLAFY